MKKLILICASLLCLSACSFNSVDEGPTFKTTAPTDIKVELKVGWLNEEKGLIEVVDKDVYINSYQKDNYNYSYFAHFDNGNYTYYTKDVLHNSDWESYVPVVTNFENMTTLDAINSLVGAISSSYSDIFNVELINGVKSSGTAEVLGIETSIHNVANRTYWYFEGINMFLKIYDETEEELSCEVTNYQYYKHFDDSPSFQ